VNEVARLGCKLSWSPASAGVIVLALALPATLLVGTAQTPLRDELIRVGGFTPQEVTHFEAGQVIARVATGGGDREVAVLAAVRIRATKEETASYFNQFISYEDGTVTLQFGRFSRPPVLQDVSRLTLELPDVNALRSCRPGDCDIRVGAAVITEFQKAIDWKAPDATMRVQNLARERIASYVTDYLARGNAALVTYNDQAKPVSLAMEWRSILENTPYFTHYTPALKAYLDDFPRASLPGGTDLIYWAKENYGLPKVVTHVTHMVTWRDPERPDRLVIAQKQIYASHYYDGSLALSTVRDAPPVDGHPTCYLLYFSRARGDLLKGGIGGVRRRLAQDQAKKAGVQTLTTIRDALEKTAGIR
jgi:hypothetical protein